ncbi:hypothetical protein [Enterococcus mundtii]|uniref:hypothetical protein n=1 Tax=Enterococcus mundtii TaxID=53346 RepID=UPI002DB964ED|nr:hypothetical protein [Enterococcus mundtii]MEC3941980.1 hypothetical protein [Enterococcus mundtii]
MKKFISLSLSALALSSFLVFNATNANASENNYENNYNMNIRSMISIESQQGFSPFSDAFQPNIINFNQATNRFDFRYGINPINPGIHHFDRNTLTGVTSRGDHVLLNNGQIEGGSIVFDVVHQVTIPNFRDFEYFRIDVSYRDALWNQRREASMTFRIN